MTDPMDGLRSFQQALTDKLIAPQICKENTQLFILEDKAEGKYRLTYAKISQGEAQAIVMFVPVEPINGKACFNVGYAVDPQHRNQGAGASILQESIEEMRTGLGRHGVGSYYLEAVVSPTNVASIKIAEKHLSAAPEKIIDQVSGENALQYLRLVTV